MAEKPKKPSRLRARLPRGLADRGPAEIAATRAMVGKIHTPIADCFLDGITRQTVIALARKRGIEVIERRIMPEELTGFSECFITGSAAEVTAVSEIAHWTFKPGAITQQLMDDYTAEVQPKGKAAAA